MRDRSEWLEIEVPDLRIVDDGLWEAVQAEIKRRQRTGGEISPADQNRKKHLLSGLIKCSCCGSNYTISGKDYYRCAAQKERLAVVETELANLAANMLSGVLNPALAKLLADREAEKTEIELRLPRTAPPQPSAQILPAPVLMEMFAKKIATLRETLDDGAIRSEAAALMDQLIEKVTIYPDGANGPEAEIVSKVADLAAFALNDNAAPWGGVSSSMALVAGARTGRCTNPFAIEI